MTTTATATALPVFATFAPVAPLAPVITRVVDDNAALPLAVASGGVTSDVLPVISGTSEPGTQVVLLDNGAIVGQAFADANWQWSLHPAHALASDVVHHFVALATRGDTGLTTSAAEVFQLTVAPPPLAAPVITAIMVMEGGVSRQMIEGGQTVDMRPELQGTSEPGSIVSIYDNGTKIGEAVSGADWTWSFTPVQAVAVDALHSFTVVASREDGSGATPSVWATTCVVGAASHPLSPPVLTAVADDRTDVPVDIPLNGISEDTTPEFYGTSEPGSIVTVLDGESVVGRTVAGADWSWSLTAEVELAPGVAHQIHVAATRADGSALTYGTADYPLWVGPLAEPVLDSSGSLDQLLLNAGLSATTAPAGPVAGGALAFEASWPSAPAAAAYQTAVPELAY